MKAGGALLGLLGFGLLAAAVGTPTRTPTHGKGQGGQGPRMAWPAYRELCARWARFWGLPVAILEVVGVIESQLHPGMIENTDPRAVSRGGSWGLFGMTMKTAEENMAKYPELRATPVSARWNGTVASLFDPEFSAMLAAHYLTTMWHMFGTPLAAVAAYQQGSGPVAHVLGRGGNLATDLPPHGRTYVERALEAFKALAPGGVA